LADVHALGDRGITQSLDLTQHQNPLMRLGEPRQRLRHGVALLAGFDPLLRSIDVPCEGRYLIIGKRAHPLFATVGVHR
jgi:hypothetical protein